MFDVKPNQFSTIFAVGDQHEYQRHQTPTMGLFWKSPLWKLEHVPDSWFQKYPPTWTNILRTTLPETTRTWKSMVGTWKFLLENRPMFRVFCYFQEVVTTPLFFNGFLHPFFISKKHFHPGFFHWEMKDTWNKPRVFPTTAPTSNCCGETPPFPGHAWLRWRKSWGQKKNPPSRGGRCK